MTLARRFLLSLVPVVVVVGLWNGTNHWLDFREQVDFIASRAMQTDIQELQVLARDPIFINYHNHAVSGFHDYAQRELEELRHIFRTLMDNAEKYGRKPSHFVLFSANWEILVLESGDGHDSDSHSHESEQLHEEPFYTRYTDLSHPFSQLDGDHHKTVVPVVLNRHPFAPVSRGEVQFYLHSDFQLPISVYRNEAFRRMIKSFWFGLGQMLLLILALVWVGHRMTQPFRAMVAPIAKLAQGDLHAPFPDSWEIRELDLLAQALNRMRAEISHREESIIHARNQADASRMMLRQVLDTIPVHVFWKDTECRYLDCNARFARLASLNGASEIVGLSDQDLIWQSHAEEFQRIDRQVIAEGQSILNHLEEVTFPDGSVRWLEINKVPLTDATGSIVGVLGASHDVTERHLLEQELIRYSARLDEHAAKLEEMVAARTRQLIHAERLATLGTFSAGMAHEINNPNAFITANVQFLQQYWQLAAPIVRQHASEDATGRVARFHGEIDKTLEGILDGSGRITRIVDGLKTYSKGGMETDRVECRVEDPVRDAENLLNHRFKQEKVVLEVTMAHDLMICCDRQQMTQVFVNLFNNASDALGEMRGIAEKRIMVHASVVERHIWIRVQDNGPGIPDSAIDKIFDPFFTTKGKTKGTGLGLSIVEGIIKDHRGQITIRSVSEPQRGTEVVIALPTVALYREQPNGTARSKGQRRKP
ncbi:MAG: PAS domain-containing protein [Magnetococcales bacterium]|nr:PAS domain-containing protein [Magnetococcales bacterium]